MKQVLRGTGGEEGGSDMERECNIEGEQEEINYLSLRGLYGELQLPVVKMDSGPEKCVLSTPWLHLFVNSGL